MSSNAIKGIFFQVVENVETMFLTFLKSVPISLVLSAIGWIILTKIGKKNPKIAKVKWPATGLIFYLSVLLQMTLFSRKFGSAREIIWYPLPGGDYLIVLYSIANLVIFIPLGILLVKTFPKFMNRAWKVGLASLFISLLLETLQYIFACGLSQVDDVVMNVVGGLVGYLIIKAIGKKNDKRKRVEN